MSIQVVRGALCLSLPLLFGALVSACSPTHVVDLDAWRQDLAAAGVSSPDMAKMQRAAEEICATESEGLEILVAMVADGKNPELQMELNRLAIEHVCPDRLADFENAQESLQDANDAVREACATDPAQRTPKQKFLADAMGCD